MRTAKLLIVGIMLGLAACATTTPSPRPASPGRHVPVARASPTQIVGQEAQAIIAALGPPALDAREGPARKLQFRGACVLDVYLYSPTPNAAPRATYVEARNPAGIDADAPACIAALERR